MEYEIKHSTNDARGMFYIKQQEKTIAQLTYTLKDKVMIIDHTEVDRPYEGKGIASRLVEAGYAFAKAESLKINPLCPVAEVVFERHPDWKGQLL